MHSVYVLYSSKYDKIYVGESSDITTRLHYHNFGPKKGWTARYRPWKLIHQETFETRPKLSKGRNSSSLHEDADGSGRNY